MLFQDKYKVLAVTNRGNCPVEEELVNGTEDTQAWRDRILEMLSDISCYGLHGSPRGWIKQVDAENDIYELKTGSLRLFYFKGNDEIVVICTSIARKRSQKVDRAEVARAIRCRRQYLRAQQENTITIVGEE